MIKQKAESRKQKAVLTCFVLCKGEVFEKETDIATTLMARDYKGLANQRGNAVIIKEEYKIE